MSARTDQTEPADTEEVRQDLDLEAQPAEPPQLGARAGLVATLRWAWRQLTSMRTALFLLFLLALAAIPGSLLPQRPANPSRVQQYFAEHPTLAPVLDKLSGFDVFGSPWFAAIYLLLFVSLLGCVIPRSRAHLAAMRARPPKAPRNLSRLPKSTRFEAAAPPEDVIAAARRLLRGRRFRVDVVEGDEPSVAAEKGYLSETGNLFFHVALVVLLVAVAIGSLFGYKGNVVVTEGDGFANTVISYDSFQHGRFANSDDLAPFTVTLDKFTASYVAKGPERGTPKDFRARLHYRERPGAPKQKYDLRVNSPLDVGGSKVYLLGHGYSPQITVRDGDGKVVSSGAVPFVAQDKNNFASKGVVKAYATKPQMGFQMFFLPTFAVTRQGPTSAYPAPLDPVILLIAYEGDLSPKNGAAQSVYTLDTSKMKQVRLPQKSQMLRPGQTVKLPGDRGSVTFTGLKEYSALQVKHDPGKVLALGSAAVAIGALLLSLFVRRRRVWVRASRAGGGRTVVEFGGLARSDGGDGFEAEFDGLAGRLREALPTHHDDAEAKGSER
ncbi:MAG: cytochrome c biogenesis protein ResB [Streptosporangiales bacterium]